MLARPYPLTNLNASSVKIESQETIGLAARRGCRNKPTGWIWAGRRKLKSWNRKAGQNNRSLALRRALICRPKVNGNFP
ncbi:MAG TPA: hypothetical protein PLG33_04545 [Prolixibacteraceae bacterium]|nr:hypothetical protein [Prolixibacteraceae bacterium]